MIWKFGSCFFCIFGMDDQTTYIFNVFNPVYFVGCKLNITLKQILHILSQLPHQVGNI